MNDMIGPEPALLDRTAAAQSLPASVRKGLADPVARISATAITRNGVRRLDCYSVSDAATHLVAMTPDSQGEATVSFPVDGALAEALVVETLGLSQPLAPIDHRSELDNAALWALAAMIDAHRQSELENLLARVAERRNELDEDAIYLRALDGAALPDPRWLSGLLTHLIGPGDVTEARLHSGLEVLARLGLIRRSQAGSWSPQPAFALSFAHLEIPLSGISLSIVRRRISEVDRLTIVFLRTIAAVWIIVPRATAGTMTLRSVSADDARGLARDTIKAAIQAKSAKPEGKSETRRFCPQCGHPASAADRFCGRCGTQLVCDQ